MTHKADSHILNLPAKSIMTKMVLTATKGQSIASTIKMLKVHQISGVPVIDEKNKLIGILTEYDLLMQAATKDLDAPINYKSKILSVKPETKLREILILLYKNRFHRLPVIDDLGQVVGIVSQIDVLHAMLESLDKGEFMKEIGAIQEHLEG